MSVVHHMWMGEKHPPKKTWKKPRAPLVERLKKAEANVQRRLKRR